MVSKKPTIQTAKIIKLFSLVLVTKISNGTAKANLGMKLVVTTLTSCLETMARPTWATRTRSSGARVHLTISAAMCAMAADKLSVRTLKKVSHRMDGAEEVPWLMNGCENLQDALRIAT